jgi:peptide/nickel transport system substrate-binding protein
MHQPSRTVRGAAAVALSLVLTACGGSNGATGTTSSAPHTGGTLKVLTGTFPDSIDPSYGYTTQAIEADNMVYTPLLVYAAKSGDAGTALAPGLAQDLPKISADGKTYTLTLRPGLKYSDGRPVKASDFAFAVQRAIKLSWGGASFLTTTIAGAADYQSGKAKSISGIVTDDSTGKITVTLTQPYGPFENVLAFPATAPLPAGTPMTVQSTTPPIGVGPYTFGKVVANASYELRRDKQFADQKIPGIPTGFVDTVDVSVQSNTNTEAEQVLQSQADIFDPADTIPSGLLSQIQSQAKDRYKQEPAAFTNYFFLDVTQPPFDNMKARLAVNMALDRTALSRLASGALTPACYFLPPSIVGHPADNSACPGGDPTTSPSKAQVAEAKKMVRDAGLAGTPVTVWSETRSPRQQYCEYLVSVLNELGFNATLKVIQDSVYFQTIGNAHTRAQTGFADWSQDFPHPSDFYLLLSKAGIQPVNSENFGNVNDPKIESMLAPLNAVPSSKLDSVRPRWEDLEKYVAKQGYIAEFGYQTQPKFMSNRVDYADTVLHPVNEIMFSTVELK